MYQLSYEMLDIIMKICPFSTPIMTIFFSTCCPNSNTLICNLDTVYRYTVFNGETSDWTCLHTYCIQQTGIYWTCLFDVNSCHFIFRKNKSLVSSIGHRKTYT